jgi:ABC-type sugar transport system ATPase subunit
MTDAATSGVAKTVAPSSPGTGIVLDLSGVTKAYPGVVALSEVDFSVAPGEVHVLLGENGAGKSTLIKIIAGAEHMDSGEYRLDGASVVRSTPARIRAIGISVIYQELSLIRTMDVASNIFLGRPNIWEHGLIRPLRLLDKKGMEAFCRNLFAELNIDIDPRSRVGELSVSEMQLIEIARAVAFQSRVILMDEPTTSIGLEEKARLFNLIEELKSRGIGVVYVSHVLEDCLKIGDRITILRDGKRVTTLRRGEPTVNELVQLMTGRTFSERYPRIESRPGEIVLEVRGLSQAGRFHGVSFDVRAGEIIGFWGLVGAGRTDVMETVFGLNAADSGEIRAFGKPVAIRTPRDAIRKGISLLTEDRKNYGILPAMSVWENILITVVNFRLGDLARTLRRVGGLLRISAARKAAKDFVRELNVRAASVDLPIAGLSGGNQQKVLFARALSAGSQIIILDEPTKGVDAGAKVEIYRVLQSLVERGIAVIVVSSELPEILAVSNRVFVMKAGALTATLERDTATDEQLMHFATA